MLVLSRQRGETVMIGDKIDVTVIDVRGDKVRLGINAPREIAVHRKEIYEQIKEQNRRSADTKLEDLPKSFAPVVAGVLPVGPARPEASGLFTVWTDPKTGIESFILSTRVAPLQQGFASAGSSMGAGERYLWFYCAFPPGADADYGRTLGVVDLFDQDVRHFPETQFGSASPLVDRASGDAFWCTGAEVYRRPAGRGAVARRIARFDAAMGKCGPTISSHLSRSADGKWLSMDAHFDDHWHVGAVAVDGSSVDVWERFEEPVTAQFSPTDSDLMLVQGEGLWVLRKGEKARKIVEGRVASAAWMGEGILAVDGEGAVVRIDLEGKREVIVKGGVEQAAVDAGGKYVVVSGGGSLRFLNLATGKEMAIVGEMPAAPQPLQHYDARPSPRFCGDDRYVCYTTTVKGQVDVALALVERLATATA